MTVKSFDGQRGTANSDSRSQQSTQKHMKWMHLSGNGDQSQAHFLFAVTLPSAQSTEKKLLQHCEYGCVNIMDQISGFSFLSRSF